VKFTSTRLSGEDFATVFLLGFGGGMVAGDRVRMHVSVLKGATLLLKTQGSTKIFKSPSSECSQSMAINVDAGGLLLFTPDPTTCFKDSKFTQIQRFFLQTEARYS
jgi:urease accessory protein